MENWKNFVVALCRLNTTNKSAEIAQVINKHGGQNVSPGQVAAVRANFKMGRYGN